MESDRDIVRRGLILRGTVGSTAHGLHLDGTDDRDEMGVAIEPPSRLIGLVPFEHHIYRTAEQRAGHDATADQRRRRRTPRSRPGDLDLVVYSLRKYARLAANGNPTVQILLFVEPLRSTPWGDRLRAEADMFASREAGARFLGYLQAQRERLLGQRGQMRVTRTELIEAHGYDTKFAMHLGYQGMEYLRTGRLTLPMTTGREHCVDVRLGGVPLAEVIRSIEELETELCLLTYGTAHVPESAAGRRDHLAGRSPLPPSPDRERIDASWRRCTPRYGRRSGGEPQHPRDPPRTGRGPPLGVRRPGRRGLAGRGPPGREAPVLRRDGRSSPSSGR